MNGKYIIFERQGLEYPILFPDAYVTHDQVNVVRDKPVSAGKWFWNEKGIVTYGESVSLKLKSRPEDHKIVDKYFQFGR